jgi:hypothetical protein
MKPPRRRTLAALGAGVAALHVGAAWQAGRTQPAAADAPPPRVMVVWLAQPEAAPAPVVAPAVAPPAAPAGPRRVPAPARRTDLAPAPLAAPDLPATEVRATSLPPTVLPPPLTLRYRLERGDTPAGEAELDWQPDGSRYAARLLLRPAAGRAIEQTSAGTLGPAGLAPLRFVDRRTGRAMAVNFQPERGVVGFSGPSLELPLPDGAQDRLSWLLQLAARVHADPAAAAAGIELPVFGARGDGGTWRFEPAGEAGGETGADGATALLHLRRAAAGPYDGAVEVWLDPARHHLPARLVLHAPAGDTRPPLVLALDDRG